MFSKTMKRLVGFTAAVALLGTPALAQTLGPADGQGRVSREGELQRGARARAEEGPRMPDTRGARGATSQGPASAPAKGQPRGEQPAWRDTLAYRTEPGSQRDEVKRARAERTHLVVVLRIDRRGNSRVESATELPGDVALSSEPRGDFLYEVRDGERTLAVEGLTDPFEAHSFGGPDDARSGHFHLAQDEATVVVKVPGRGLGSALDGLDVQLYQLTEGAPTPRLDVETVKELRDARRLKPLLSSSHQRLGEGIRAVGVKSGN